MLVLPSDPSPCCGRNFNTSVTVGLWQIWLERNSRDFDKENLEIFVIKKNGTYSIHIWMSKIYLNSEIYIH
jgi:hypothetical protein